MKKKPCFIFLLFLILLAVLLQACSDKKGKGDGSPHIGGESHQAENSATETLSSDAGESDKNYTSVEQSKSPSAPNSSRSPDFPSSPNPSPDKSAKPSSSKGSSNQNSTASSPKTDTSEQNESSFPSPKPDRNETSSTPPPGPTPSADPSSLAGANGESNETPSQTAEELEIEVPTFLVDSAEARPGEKKIPIKIALKANPGISSMGLLVSYDKDLMLDSVTYNSEIGGQTMESALTDNPAKLIWISPLEEVEGDWTFVTLYFNVAKDAAKGGKQIALSYNPDDVYGIDEENIDFSIVNGAITIN